MIPLRPILANAGLLAGAVANRSGRAVLRRGFDRAYYTQRYPDVRNGRLPAFLHYALFGYQEFRDPSAAFSTAYYLRRNPDVFEASVCPLLHYAALGRKEGRPCAPAEPSESSTSSSGTLPQPWPEGLPLVSVVVPCFNYGRFLADALESVQRQTFRDFEILVVEGGSTDAASRAKVRELESSARFPARFFYRSEPARVGDNRNFGIAHARGKYICCLDADDRLLPTYLAAAVFYAEAGDYDIVSPSLRCFGQQDHTWHASEATLEELRTDNTLTSASLFRREVWDAIGGFRDFGLGAEHAPEDWDFWLRAIGAGFVAAAIPAPLYEYRVHEASLSAHADTSSYRARIQEANPLLLKQAAAPRCRRPPPDPTVNLHRHPASSGPPGILLCLPWITLGGAENLLCAIFSGLAARGVPVAAVTTSHLKPLMVDDSARFEQAGIPVYPCPELFPEGAAWSGFLRYLLRHYRAGHLYLCGSEYTYTQLASLRSEFPGLRVFDQLFNDEGHLRSNRRAAASIDLTLVPSEALRRVLTVSHGEREERVRVIRHGLLPFSGAAGAEPDLPERFQGKFLVTFAGRLAPEKDPVFFVELAAHLGGEQFAFMLLGDGPERPAVEAAIRRHRLQPSLFFPGAVPDARPYLRRSDAVVVPSRVDGMPNVILEAMAEGIPVVASPVGGIPEMVLDGRTGLLCPAGSLDAFAGAIRHLAEDRNLRAAFSASARAHVAGEFSFGATIAAYRRLFGLE